MYVMFLYSNDEKDYDFKCSFFYKKTKSDSILFNWLLNFSNMSILLPLKPDFSSDVCFDFWKKLLEDMAEVIRNNKITNMNEIFISISNKKCALVDFFFKKK